MKQPPPGNEPLGPFLSRNEIGHLLAETARRNLARTGRAPRTPGTTTPRSR